MMRQLLILAWDFPPQGASSAIRAAKLCKYLPEFGWMPIVVCPDAITQYDPSLLGDIPPEVEVRRVQGPQIFFKGLPQSPSSSPDRSAGSYKDSAGGDTAQSDMVRRLRALAREMIFPDPQVLWVRSLVQEAERVIHEKKPAAMLTMALPFSLHLVGYWCKRRYPHLPWVADYRDYWSPSFQEGMRRWLAIGMERHILQRADAAVFVTEAQRGSAVALLGQDIHLDSEVITNGYDADDFNFGKKAENPRGPHFTLTYAGSLLKGRMQTMLFPALYEACTDPEVRTTLRVHIWGHFADLHPDITAQLMAWNVLQLHPFSHYKTVLEAMWQSNALLLVESDTPVMRTNHSNKLFEYLAVGHPILAIVPEGEIARLIRELEAGLVVHPTDREGLVNAIKKLIVEWQQNPVRGESGLEKYRQFNRREIACQMADLLVAVSQSVQ